MTVFVCIVSFMLGWIAHKAADMYDKKKREKGGVYNFLVTLVFNVVYYIKEDCK